MTYYECLILAIGADGDIYISNQGFIARQGEVLRLSLEKDTTFGCAPLYDPVKHCMMAIAADSDLANDYHPLLSHSFSVQSHSEAF